MSPSLWPALQDGIRSGQNMKAAENVKRIGHKKNAQKASVALSNGIVACPCVE